MIRLILASCLISLAAILVIACKPKHNATTPPAANVDKSQIVALLQPRKSPDELEMAFKANQLKAKGQTSRSENKWIFTYDMSTIKPEDLLAKIKTSPIVVEAHFPQVKADLHQ